VDSTIVGEIARGLVVFLGVGRRDTKLQAERLAAKIIRLRIFPDEQGKMNRSVLELQGKLLIVSQFTLYGDTAAGNRPSYSDAAGPELAQILYEHFVLICRSNLPVETGIFQARMQVQLINDGPVTLMCYAEP
jgi:D-tyrosyl-tRNA(Tyr) deacylase